MRGGCESGFRPTVPGTRGRRGGVGGGANIVPETFNHFGRSLVRARPSNLLPMESGPQVCGHGVFTVPRRSPVIIIIIIIGLLL